MKTLRKGEVSVSRFGAERLGMLEREANRNGEVTPWSGFPEPQFLCSKGIRLRPLLRQRG